MIKTLLVLTGAVLLAVPALHAQSRRFDGGRPSLARAYRGGGSGYGYRHGGHYGRYYYYGGIPYFYPFFGYGFGYPGYYDGGYGDGFGGAYGYGSDYGAGNGYGAGGAGNGYGAYEGRINDSGRNGSNGSSSAPSGDGGSLPQAVQRQLAKKGYYKGSVDGQFGPASRSALSRYQREHNLKETGRIDEDTLDSLGFTDHQ